MNEKVLNTCIKCKKLSSCKVKYNSSNHKYEFLCDNCGPVRLDRDGIMKLGWKRAYRKAYYQRTGK